MKLVSSRWTSTRMKDISLRVFSKMTRGSSDWQRRQLGAITMAKLFTSIFVMDTLAGWANTCERDEKQSALRMMVHIPTEITGLRRFSQGLQLIHLKRSVIYELWLMQQNYLVFCCLVSDLWHGGAIQSGTFLVKVGSISWSAVKRLDVRGEGEIIAVCVSNIIFSSWIWSNNHESFKFHEIIKLMFRVFLLFSF